MTDPAEAAASPLDRALRSRPRGNPHRPLKRPPITDFPADYDHRLGRTDQGRRALRTTEEVWRTAVELYRGGEALPKLSRATISATERVYRDLDSATELLGAERERLSKKIGGEIARGADGKVAAEVRAHFKGLPRDEALTAARRSIEDGDSTVVQAILGAPALLSGFDAQALGVVRQLAETRWAPKDVEARDGVDRDLALLARAKERFHEEIWSRAVEWDDAPAEKKLRTLAEGADES